MSSLLKLQWRLYLGMIALPSLADRPPAAPLPLSSRSTLAKLKPAPLEQCDRSASAKPEPAIAEPPHGRIASALRERPSPLELYVPCLFVLGDRVAAVCEQPSDRVANGEHVHGRSPRRRRSRRLSARKRCVGFAVA
jgi:hypothetical protein